MNQLTSLFLDRNILVEAIEYDPQKKQTKFFLRTPHIILSKELNHLEASIAEKIKVSSVDLCLRYEIHKDWDGILEEYKEVLYERLEDLCPSLSGMRKKINLDIRENRLILNVEEELLFESLRKNRVEQILEEMIREQLDYPCKGELSIKQQEKDFQKFIDRQQSHLGTLASIAQQEEGAGRPDAVVSEKKSKLAFDKKAGSAKNLSEKRYSKKRGENPLISIQDIKEAMPSCAIEGQVFASNTRSLRTGRNIFTFNITDKKDSISCKLFLKKEEEPPTQDGEWVRLYGDVVFDPYAHELIFQVKDVEKKEQEGRKDTWPQKRVELHAHTSMSSMDATVGAKELVAMAAQFGHKAVAITDHGVVQAFPEAMDAGKKYGVKILYGMEAYLVDDNACVMKETNQKDFAQAFVVFDIETTGFSAQNDEIIEIGAVRIEQGEIIARYSQLVRPTVSIPPRIQELTGIDNTMVADKKEISEVLPDFLEFAKDSVLVAHNSEFDMSFIREKSRRLGLCVEQISVDTLALARALLPHLKRHRLDVVAKEMGVSLENHHRAVEDAEATAQIFLGFLKMLEEKGATTLADINHIMPKPDTKQRRAVHAVLLVQNQQGLKNLYRLVSNAHLHHFYKTPRVMKSELEALREGLLIGSACASGELYQAILRGLPPEEVEKIADWYDYLEIMPVENNRFLLEEEQVSSIEALQEINRKIVTLGEKIGKKVVATGDVHFLEKEDALYRKILKHSLKFKNLSEENSLYFRTTDEMIREFQYLGEEKAAEVVIHNPTWIADQMEELLPVPKGTFPPVMEGSDQELREMCYGKAKETYGDPLPSVVQARLDRELNSIIGNGYAVMYMIAQKLVHKSVSEGYLVGSRGSVGSSLAATMSGITEVNPLEPHYICPSCKYSEFILDGSYSSGVDMPDKPCPRCSTLLMKDGHSIPFEVFLGFEGDKEPDIDLNFAGEYQPRAHKYTEDLFGEGYVFRAGTIGTVAEKTAYGYVMKYLEETAQQVSKAEAERLRMGCTGIKRTSGQHPGGVMVVPSYKDIYDFSPIQYPANDASSGVITTHFDYHSISGRILKLDILGHDVPSIIRMLEDLTGQIATDVALDDGETMSLFSSVKALSCDLSAIGCDTGTLGIPEFGTRFVRQMLMDTLPTTFEELVRISGLSHGTDVWLNNAQSLIRDKVITLKEAICTRDDIMNYLILKGVPPKISFKIMENVRKGKGLKDDEIAAMKEHAVPSWYIESCQKIKYMFPKAHAVAYVTMSYRIAWFKINFKEAFYASYFTTKAEDLDLDLVAKGKEAVQAKLQEIENLGNEVTQKEKNMATALEVAYEMLARDVEVLPVDIYHSHPRKFLLEDGKLRPPLICVQGLGLTVAEKIKEEAGINPFISQEDFRLRTRASKTVVEVLVSAGCLATLPQENQISF